MRGYTVTSTRSAVKAFLAIAIWGASFVATKIALEEISPLAVVVVRFAIGLGTIAVVLAWRHQLRLPHRRDIGWLALLGLNGIAVHQLLQTNGLVTTTATNSGWIMALIPILTAVLARTVVGEPFGRLKMLGLGVAMFGTLVILGRGVPSFGLFRAATVGDLLMLASAVNWAVFTVLSKRGLGRYPPGLLIAYIIAFGWLMTLPLVGVQGGLQQAALMSARGWAAMLFLGVFCSGLAYAFWYDALAETDASALASFIYLEPVVTSILAATVIGEAITWSVPVGGATILLGVCLVNRRSSARSRCRPASAACSPCCSPC